MRPQSTKSPKNCEHCGNSFLPNKPTSRFCGIRCSNLARPTLPLADRFWAKVDRSGGDDSCWIWQGRRDKDGYGRFSVTSASHRPAHSISWTLTHGPIPDAALICCHTCDTPSCVNPAHLFLGTNADNVADRHRKGRDASGARNGTHTHPERVARGAAVNTARLTADQVRELRVRAAQGESYAALGRDYSITTTAARSIVIRKNWAHVQ